MLKMVTLNCYWNEKVIAGRKGVSYKGLPPTATVLLYDVIGV